jgi:REP-associated tyrosine transposase
MSAKPRKHHVQQELPLAPRSGRGGKREGAGRKPKVPRKPGEGPGVAHTKRPPLAAKHPVHVTLRIHEKVPNLRRTSLLWPLTDTLRAGRQRSGFRLCHYVIMGNHLHLIVEADDEKLLARGVQGLCIRIDRRVNRELAQTGRVFGDRYYAHILRTPTETHRALSYVLLNYRKHVTERSSIPPRGLDAFSSGPWFAEWHTPPREAARLRQGQAPPTTAPHGWLLREGWKRAGIISLA